MGLAAMVQWAVPRPIGEIWLKQTGIKYMDHGFSDRNRLLNVSEGMVNGIIIASVSGFVHQPHLAMGLLPDT